MDLKLKLQRVLQIVEESERVGALSDLERYIILNDLREVYAELKFGITENEKQKTENKPPSIMNSVSLRGKKILLLSIFENKKRKPSEHFRSLSKLFFFTE